MTPDQHPEIVDAPITTRQKAIALAEIGCTDREICETLALTSGEMQEVQGPLKQARAKLKAQIRKARYEAAIEEGSVSALKELEAQADKLDYDYAASSADTVENNPHGKRGQVVAMYDRFIMEYLANGRNLVAAVVATYGPSHPNPEATGKYLLQLAYVQQKTNEVIRAKFEELDISANRVLQELYFCATANLADYGHIEPDGTFTLDLTKCTRDQLTAVQEVGYDARGRQYIRLCGKLEAKRLLGSYFRLFSERHEITGPGGTPLTPPALTVRFLKKRSYEASG